MDFHTLTRRQLQSLCKKNKIRANMTNVAMANALTSLDLVEGIEEIMNTEISQSSMVPPTVGRTRTAKVVGTTTRRKATAASTSVPTMIEVSSNKSLDEVEDKKSDVSVTTPTSRRRVVREMSTVSTVCSIRRSARLAKRIENSKERSEGIQIHSLDVEIDESDEVEIQESSVDQNETSDITVLDNFQKILTLSEEVEVKNSDEFKAYSEEKSDVPHGENIVACDIKADTEMSFNVDNGTKASTDKDTGMSTIMYEDTEMSSNVDEEAQSCTEKETEMQSNLDEEVKAFIEKETAMKSNVEEKIETSIEEKTIMNFNAPEETKTSIKEDATINSNVDEENKASNEMDVIMDEETKDTAMNYDVDEDTMAFIQKDTIQDEEVNSFTKEDAEMNLKNKSTLSEDIELKNNDESEANIEESSDISNGNVAVASIENMVASTDTDQEEDGPVDGLMKEDDLVEIKAEVDEERVGTEVVQEYNVSGEMCGMDTEMYYNLAEQTNKASTDTTEMHSNLAEQSKSSPEDTVMNSNEDDGTKASIEDIDVHCKGVQENNEEAKESSEVTKINSNENDGTEPSIGDTDMNCSVDQETASIDEKAKDSLEAPEMNSNEDHETMAFIEETYMNSKVDQETMAFIDANTDMTFKEDGGIVAELKVVGSCNVENEQQWNHGEKDKELVAYTEDVDNDGHEESCISENKTSDDDESDDCQDEFSIPEVGGIDDMIKDETLNGKDNLEAGFGADDSVTEFNQEEMNLIEVQLQNGDENETSGDEESDMSAGDDELEDDKANLESDFAAMNNIAGDENETSDDEESDMSDGDDLEDDKANLGSDFAVDVSDTESNQEEMAISEAINVFKVDIQDEDEHLNSEAKHESDPIQIIAPLKNDDGSSIEPLKAPRSVPRLTHILKDDKENVGSGRKSGILKDGTPKKKPLEDSSIVELAKMLQDKWNISKQENEDGKEAENIFIKSTITRPALKVLSENRMGFESQN